MESFRIPDSGLCHLNALFRCELCDRQFPTLLALRDHVKEEFGVEPELLEFLDLDLGIVSEPLSPESQHSASTGSAEAEPVQSIPCPKCPKVCKNHKGFKQHLAKAHQNRKKPVHCGECGKGFKHKHALSFHVKQVHLRATRVNCPRCNKEVYNKYMLRKHLLSCSG